MRTYYDKLEMNEAYDESPIAETVKYLPDRYIHAEQEIIDAMIRYAVHLESNQISPDEGVRQSQCVLNLASALETLMRVEKNAFLDPLLAKVVLDIEDRKTEEEF